MAKLPWTPWHEVVRLREELKTGELPLHLFAADLYEVLMQGGKRPIYEDPEKFFALTFPTFNLRRLVRDVVLRVAGENDKAVRQLELTYGGGKTHTLITLRHLVTDPEALPDLPAVAELTEAVGRSLPRARVACLCFDKLDVEKGMEVLAPGGEKRTLLHPWSVLAYQIAGDDGLRLLHAEGLAEERESAPAENLLTELLERPGAGGSGTLVLIDEVLMFAREKVAADGRWADRLRNFFQYLTQAATKVDRCCVVASLLASDPVRSDSFGRRLQGDLYDIFQRQREEAVEPVVKEDVAEVLRRRFFTPESLKDRDAFRRHAQAAIKGVAAIDELTARQGAEAEERFARSYPFHPDLTEVFYTKWTQLDRFQRARGVLRTFALALREAEAWDTAPLVGPSVFLAGPGRQGLSEALREIVTVADTEEHEGKRQSWTGILEGELDRAREIERDALGLRGREVEQAVVATFLHSQPIGQSARIRDLLVLLGPARPDKIELEKGLVRWAQASFWLDDRYAAGDGQLPSTWRLGNRPNLTQMHAAALGRLGDDLVRARLVEEIGKTKELSTGAAAAGVRVHTLPARPREVEDDGFFHYAVLGPEAASESGKPAAEARRFLDETTGAEKPRVHRNAVLLLTPSRDGLEVARARVRDYLGWEQVRQDLKEQQEEGDVDPARAGTLAIHIDKSRGKIAEAIRQAYCVVVTVSEQDEPQAFKITVGDDPHFTTIKNDGRARVRDAPVTAEALLPGGPYDLWRERETVRRVKDLAGAFAQLPHLPKMLKARAILETLTQGCEQGSFVLALSRPDGSTRTWWRSRPDEAALTDPALELVLSENATLTEVPAPLLVPGELPGLWEAEQVSVGEVIDYFGGGRTVQVARDGYSESVTIPKAGEEAVRAAVARAVEAGLLWLINRPATILAEPIPAGVLTPDAVLRAPPPTIGAVEILPANLPDAWQGGTATALAISAALSQKLQLALPWKSVKDVVTAALSARFVELDAASASWPCEYPGAASVQLQVTTGAGGGLAPDSRGGLGAPLSGPRALIASAELEPSELQDLADLLPALLEIKARAGVPLRLRVQIELGDGTERPPEDAVTQVDEVLGKVKEDFRVE